MTAEFLLRNKTEDKNLHVKIPNLWSKWRENLVNKTRPAHEHFDGHLRNPERIRNPKMTTPKNYTIRIFPYLLSCSRSAIFPPTRGGSSKGYCGLRMSHRWMSKRHDDASHVVAYAVNDYALAEHY
jgi:hypothetical protein